MSRAAVLTEYGEPLSIKNRDAPEVTPDGVVVETEACGICRSDWHGWRGHWPGTPPEGHVLGHEPAGTVVAVGEEVETFREGDRVGIPFNVACGHCEHCWDGESQVCANGLSLGFSPDLPGAFASEFAIPHADFNATHLPESMSAVEMAGLGCRFATSFHALAHKANVSAGDWLAVHGCGGVGLSAVHVADALGANVVAVDLSDDSLEMAAAVGATATVDAETTDVPAEIQSITDGGADVSVDALGIAETCRNSVACLGTQGQHVQVGMTTDEEAGEISLPVDGMINDEIEFVGAKGMPPNRYDELLGMIATGKLSPEKLITERVALEDVSERLAAMDNFGTVGIEVVTSF
ncbi:MULTISPECIES: zinc-dependent alcohol dehydrogenase family protein [Halorussus]|uniref:zinc-dependent alcohol dehydrogenase family protein n=1 Tax=Halorussus TaxID=1070314 RepID=UPI0020A0195B|nr:zinc-dependent alcohol dehydrogenase family protein [Halorussus vallis]USZ77406.1 zinc-dependent alcohol dehydrogenase family protein [Halorussus vallis]